MQNKEQKRSSSRVRTIKNFASRLLLFSLAYLATFLVTATLYFRYIESVSRFKSLVDAGDIVGAKNSIDNVVSAYWTYSLAMVLMNIMLIVLLSFLVLELIRVQYQFKWKKAVKTSKIVIGILMVIGIVTYLFVLWVSYTNMGLMRAYLSEYIVNTNVEPKVSPLFEYALYGYLITYFLLGLVLFYVVMSAYRIFKQFQVLNDVSRRLKWFSWIVFVYFFEPYMPLKLTWFLFPIFAYRIYSSARKLVGKRTGK